MTFKGLVRAEDQQLKRLYVDTAPGTRTGQMVRACIEAYGPDQVMFGTDYPTDYGWFKTGVSTIEKLDIDEKTKRKILGENAAKLFKI